VSGETIAFDQYPGGERRVGYWVPEPVGIVAALTPFNDPLNLVAHKVGPGLAAGNAVIVKPDSKTPLSALKLARAIHDAGMPAGILQCLTGPGSVIGDVLVTDPRVRMVSFTGGTEAGKVIASRAGLKKIGMELGSNSPVIVMPDADLDFALESTVSGAFWAAGQNCLHVQRLLLHEEIYEAFRARFVAAAEAYVVGDKLDEATDMGPLINEAAAQNVERLVNDAVAAGARLLTGGRRHGAFYDPTVLENLPDECELAAEEVYGPVTVLYGFDSLDEAIRRSNQVDYGLHAAIFTRDVDSALRAAEELECGGVMINESTDYRMDAMPFGGVKGSGLGREGIKFAIREMTEPKTVCFNRR
jgi:glyceraldehyde-3-phosphate dehydrogenase (NADP+)